MSYRFLSPLMLVLLLQNRAGLGAEDPPKVIPEGHEKSVKTEMLEAGARVLQDRRPVEALDIHLVGFHPMKDDANQQMEAHHFCRQVNEDFAQCALFDGDGPAANLNGIEYIISERVFDGLPQDEKKYWHPHNYEILSGQLFAPGIFPWAERELMRSKMNSYGKTWHVWNTGHFGAPGDTLPLGEPRLAWSFNRDGEAQADMLRTAEKKFDVSMQKKRVQRTGLRKLAKDGMSSAPLSGDQALKACNGAEIANCRRREQSTR